MQDRAMDEALQVATAKFRKRMRGRMLASVVLLVLGGGLLYTGFAEDQAVSKTFGVIFILYSGVIQARIFSAKRFVADARAELERKRSG